MTSYLSGGEERSKIVISNEYKPNGRFTFADHKLAIQVRGRMKEHVTYFDLNHNKKFEESEIRNLLVTLMGEDQNQVAYVIKNVFRYDRNNDGYVTYDQFVNFATEQHFGELSIQRHHKNGLYSKGSSRIMNCQEFCHTIGSCLEAIQCKGTQQMYQQLFREIDLDKNGWISYEDYFYFLRQYFGSGSYAASIGEIKVEENTEPDFKDGNNETAQQRVAKLVYAQLKISVMLQDFNKNLYLERSEVERIIEDHFGLRGYERQQVVKRVIDKAQISYEEFMKKIVPLYLGEIDIKRNYPNLSRIENSSFAMMFNKAIPFVEVKPAEHILQKIFEKTDTNSDGYISLTEYLSMVQRIFGSYQFDQRGIPRAHRS